MQMQVQAQYSIKVWILPVYILSIVKYHKCSFPLKIPELRL